MQMNEVVESEAPVKAPLVLDARPIFARGETPCDQVNAAVAALVPGQPFVLMAPKKPGPLFEKMAALGYTHCAEAAPDGGWRIEFIPGAAPISSGTITSNDCSCH